MSDDLCEQKIEDDKDMTNSYVVCCFGKFYRYKGCYFEFHRWVGPWPLKKDGDPKARAGRGFYKLYEEFAKLTDEQQESYQIDYESM